MQLLQVLPAFVALIAIFLVKNCLSEVEDILDKIAGAETVLDVEAYWGELISQLSELSGCSKVCTSTIMLKQDLNDNPVH